MNAAEEEAPQHRSQVQKHSRPPSLNSQAGSVRTRSSLVRRRGHRVPLLQTTPSTVSPIIR